jgi:hypothetical protein
MDSARFLGCVGGPAGLDASIRAAPGKFADERGHVFLDRVEDVPGAQFTGELGAVRVGLDGEQAGT